MNTVTFSASVLRVKFLRFWPWLLVLSAILFTGFVRWRLLDMPLERDEGEYAYAGQLIQQGIPPYQLAYNMKLPGTYYMAAAGMALFGQDIKGLHLTLLVVNAATIVFVFLLGRKLFGPLAGGVASISYGLMTLNPAVLGLAAHATHFVVLFAVPAIWLLLLASEQNRRSLLVFSGLLFGLAFLMKQHGIFFCAFGMSFLLWRCLHHRGRNHWIDALIFGTAMILPFLILCCVMVFVGVFHAFWFWTFIYAHDYAAMVPWSEGERLLWLHLRAAYPTAMGFWLMTLLGFWLGIRDGQSRKATIWMAVLWLFSFLAAATGFYFRGHYFIMLLPACSILIGLGVKTLQENLRGRLTAKGAKTIPMILFAAACFLSIAGYGGLYFHKSGLEACQSIYRGFPFAESLTVAKYIRENSSPEARVAVVGSEPQIYFYARRHSATGYIYAYPLMEPQANAPQMQRQMIREIEAVSPEYLVWVGYDNSWWVQPSSDREIFSWFDKYAGSSYERVGLIDTHSDGKTIELWGEDAKNFHGLVENYLTIYKRVMPPKPDLNKR